MARHAVLQLRFATPEPVLRDRAAIGLIASESPREEM